MDLVSWVTLISAIAAAIVSIITAIRVPREVQALHVLVNSRLSELLRVTAGQSHAEGMNAGRALGFEAGRKSTLPATHSDAAAGQPPVSPPSHTENAS